MKTFIQAFAINSFFILSIQAASLSDLPEIKYETFKLDNGLTVIVHEDKKVPMVAVNVWYHVGSKNEKEGKTGFAHLFEHLMFNGTENFNNEYFEPFEKIGSTDQNGTTNSDRTNYFQNVPTNALDLALWMESDRMGHLLGVVNQEKLDEQRGVVQNEKRQGENQPYGKAFTRISESGFPKGHPYSWSVIGSMEDLDAASLEDVQEWFKTYYGPNNAVLALAGDIDLETAKLKVAKYFADIPSGPPLVKPEKWIAKRTEEKREIMFDDVPQARIYKIWNVPEAGTEAAAHFDLASSVLVGGKNSPLYKELVYDKQIATSVSSFYYDREIAGMFFIVADVVAGVDPSEVESAMDDVMANFIKRGPNAKLLKAEKTKTLAAYIRGIQRIGGFGGKSDLLATCQTYTGDPSCYQKNAAYLDAVTPAKMKATFAQWIDDTPYVLTILPTEKFAVNSTDLDRSVGIPYPTDKVEFTFPTLQTATLSNGSKVVLAQRTGVPLVEMNFQFDFGYAQEDNDELGYTNFMMSMLNEGTKKYSSLEFDEVLDSLGSNLGFGSGLDSSLASLSALKDNLPATLDLAKEALVHPTFPVAEIDRIKKQTLASIIQEENRPASIAYRNIGKLLYGEGHPYGKPLTGSGVSETIAAITRADILDVHARAINPANLTFAVAGDINLNELVELLESKFGDWTSENDAGLKALTQVALPQTRTIYLIDKPNAQQSYIVAGQLLPPTATDEEIALNYMNYAIGGSFTARLNMNLREDKSWSYGVRTRLGDAKGQRAMLVTAPVQTDKTAESMAEIVREYADYLSTKPITEDELAKGKASKTLRLPGQFETLGALKGGVADIVSYDRDLNYLNELPMLLDRPTLSQVQEKAQTYIKPDQWTWLIVGDLAKIEAPIRDLNLGNVVVMD
ncbi:insulinase family protein [Gammaproteobacteria bacterium]|nr:insulinase family protein [Gammaproteobacteria bacterium]MDB9896553.1 insulinase family protein [Gammaproteobacteria bacterium]|tara:strand:+ start:3960 stop:6680 length:2721 start_codon:yes stop_codon:yes gene_type:complete